jgi:hypothetical protein
MFVPSNFTSPNWAVPETVAAQAPDIRKSGSANLRLLDVLNVAFVPFNRTLLTENVAVPLTVTVPLACTSSAGNAPVKATDDPGSNFNNPLVSAVARSSPSAKDGKVVLIRNRPLFRTKRSVSVPSVVLIGVSRLEVLLLLSITTCPAGSPCAL